MLGPVRAEELQGCTREKFSFQTIWKVLQSFPKKPILTHHREIFSHTTKVLRPNHSHLNCVVSTSPSCGDLFRYVLMGEHLSRHGTFFSHAKNGTWNLRELVHREKKVKVLAVIFDFFLINGPRSPFVAIRSRIPHTSPLILRGRTIQFQMYFRT